MYLTEFWLLLTIILLLESNIKGTLKILLLRARWYLNRLGMVDIQ